MQSSRKSNPAALNEASTALVETKTDSEMDSGDRPSDCQLPLPAGSLPPRKRARTKDEKEQRRIERIMRNRQAAHASREKKRRHVEDLEAKCKALTSKSAELEEKLRQTQRSQVQSQEQCCTLRSKLAQLEAAVQLARTSGDLSVLDSVPSDASAAGGLAFTPLPGVETAVGDECASPGALQLGGSQTSVPSLSNSASNSPAAWEDEMDTLDSLDACFSTLENPTYSAFTGQDGELASFDSSSKAHHPAAMMPFGLLASL